MAQSNLRMLTIVALLALPSAASAQATEGQTPGRPMAAPESGPKAAGNPEWSDRARMKEVAGERDILRQALSAGKSREEYREILQKNDYMITSINEESDDELELEVVRGDHSLEVQFEFEGPGAAKEIEISTNAWRAPETKRAMDDKSYKPGGVAFDPSKANSSDRANAEVADDEKDRLESLMRPGQKVSAYKTILEGQGYKLTSVNETDPTSAEYEIVKGQQSYEVLLEIDRATQNVTDVDVETNIWQSKETEDALGQS